MIPWWGWLVFAALCSPFALLSIPFAIGLYSYVLLYEIAHFACHSHYWWSLPFTTHHLYHHYLDSSKNHATFYGFIDRLFGTYQEVSCDDEQVIHSRLYGD
jgi:sterol desaturase/sphingolipid hydroxylase (fatty acid hydroxylase superfamily)